MINLLINGIAAMPKGGTLRLSSRDETDAQGSAGVVIDVCDSGPGLSPEVQSKLFHPFFTTRNDGNGLGLWISLGLVERYGGSIRGSNRRDVGADAPGAVFSIWLVHQATSGTD